MKRIPLTKGKEALADDEDYEYLMKWKWHAATGGQYAARDGRSSDRRHGGMIYMHRAVAERMGLKPAATIDHRNGNKLDNRRSNLRPATQSEQEGNCRLRADNRSGYRGVTWDKQTGRWRAQIGIGGRHICLKRFDDPKDAARAYNKAALRYFGEFAFLNPV